MISDKQLFKIAFFSGNTQLYGAINKQGHNVLAVNEGSPFRIQITTSQNGVYGYSLYFDNKKVSGNKLIHLQSEFSAINDAGIFKAITFQKPQAINLSQIKFASETEQQRLKYGLPNIKIEFYDTYTYERTNADEPSAKLKCLQSGNARKSRYNPLTIINDIKQLNSRPLTLAGGKQIYLDIGYKGKSPLARGIDCQFIIDSFTIFYSTYEHLLQNSLIENTFHFYGMIPESHKGNYFADIFLNFLREFKEKECPYTSQLNMIELSMYFQKRTKMNLEKEMHKKFAEEALNKLISKKVIIFEKEFIILNDENEEKAVLLTDEEGKLSDIDEETLNNEVGPKRARDLMDDCTTTQNRIEDSNHDVYIRKIPDVIDLT